MGGRVVVVIGCVGVGSLLAWWAWRRRYPETPCRWEEVGEVGELIVYPLKSGRGVKVTEAEATRYGLAVDLMEDRSFVAAYPSNVLRGKFDSGMFDVTLTLDGSMVTLRCRQGKEEEEEEEVHFDLQDVIKEGKVVEIPDHRYNVKGYDCGDEAAAWLTKVTQATGEGETVRLVYNGDLMRNRRPETVLKLSMHKTYTYRFYKPSDRVTYAESAAYMLASETSLADLNERLLRKVTLDWFRPNLVVRGVRRAYDEDDWAYVRIGDVVLRRVKPCTKHVFKYVDPETGEKSTDQEDYVLKKTLISSRKIKGPKGLEYYFESTPVFGVHLGIDSCGKMRVGDKVEVARVSSNPRWEI